MPYLALDLDAREKCELAARACGVDPGAVLWGLTGLWLHVWRTESDIVPPVVLAGCFGAHPGMPDALEAFGFIERCPEGIRVRGADRYLRVKQAQREGGKKGRAKSTSPVGNPVAANDADKVSPRSTLKSTSRSPQALTANSEQRTANSKKEEEAPSSPKVTTAFVVSRPTADPNSWLGDDFWRWFQSKRQDAGFIAEPGPPHAVGRWYAGVMQTINGDVERLQDGVYRFGDSKHWQKATPPLPWAAFQKLWSDFLPRGEVNDSA